MHFYCWRCDLLADSELQLSIYGQWSSLRRRYAGQTAQLGDRTGKDSFQCPPLLEGWKIPDALVPLIREWALDRKREGGQKFTTTIGIEGSAD